MAVFDVAALAVMLETASAPVVEQRTAAPPTPVELLEFVGEFGDDHGQVIDPTQLAGPAPQSPPVAARRSPNSPSQPPASDGGADHANPPR